MPTLDDAERVVLDAYRRRQEQRERHHGNKPLWPDDFCDDSADTAFRWLTQCWWTLNEADQSIALIPAKDYVGWLCEEWLTAFKKRQPLLLEKSRRVVVSWICRGLETWQLGKRRGEWIVIDQTHENSSEHLWRVAFALKELRDRRPEFHLPEFKDRGSFDAKSVTHVLFPNGSIFTQGHQDAGSKQGKGKTGVSLEELSRYRNAGSFWGQALIVTQGAAGGSGGWVCGINNASPNPEYQRIKNNRSAREMLGL